MVDEEVENKVAAFDSSDMEIMKNSGVEKEEKIITVSDTIFCNNKVSEHLSFSTAVEVQKNGGNNSNVSSGVSQTCHDAEEEGKALSKSQTEIGQKIVYPMECYQSAQLKFIGQSGESSVQVTPGKKNCKFVEPLKNGGSSSISSSGYDAEAENKAVPKLRTGIHQATVSQMECTSLNDNKQSTRLKLQFGGHSVPVTTGMQNCRFGVSMKFIKKEPVTVVKKSPRSLKG